MCNLQPPENIRRLFFRYTLLDSSIEKNLAQISTTLKAMVYNIHAIKSSDPEAIKAINAACELWQIYPELILFINDNSESNTITSNPYEKSERVKRELNTAHKHATDLLKQTALCLNIDANHLYECGKLIRSFDKDTADRIYSEPIEPWPDSMGTGIYTLPEGQKCVLQSGMDAFKTLILKFKSTGIQDDNSGELRGGPIKGNKLNRYINICKQWSKYKSRHEVTRPLYSNFCEEYNFDDVDDVKHAVDWGRKNESKWKQST